MCFHSRSLYGDRVFFGVFPPLFVCVLYRSLSFTRSNNTEVLFLILTCLGKCDSVQIKCIDVPQGHTGVVR